MKTPTNFWVVVLLFGFVLTFPVLTMADISYVRSGVVKITVNAPASKAGAGIVVCRTRDDAYIVTAAHVVSGADDTAVWPAGVPKSSSAEVMNIEIGNPTQGLALLRVPRAPKQLSALELSAEPVDQGSQVDVIVHQSSTGEWGILSGTVAKIQGRELVIQAPVEEQASGGPVLFEGRVAGLMQRKDPSGKFGFAVTAPTIREYVVGFPPVVDACPNLRPSIPSTHKRFYMGGSLGMRDGSDANAIPDGIIPGGIPSKMTSGAVGPDFGFKIFGGYLYNRNFALEFAYMDLGTADYSGKHYVNDITDGQNRVSGFNVSAVGQTVVVQDFNVFARIGVFFSKTTASETYIDNEDPTLPPNPESIAENNTKLSLGLGASYKLSKEFEIRCEWERLGAVGDLDFLSAGVAFKF